MTKKSPEIIEMVNTDVLFHIVEIMSRFSTYDGQDYVIKMLPL